MFSKKCGESSNLNCTKAISEIYRTLKNGGIYVLVSYGSPDSRRPYLQKVTKQFCFLLKKRILCESIIDFELA